MSPERTPTLSRSELLERDDDVKQEQHSFRQDKNELDEERRRGGATDEKSRRPRDFQR